MKIECFTLCPYTAVYSVTACDNLPHGCFVCNLYVISCVYECMHNVLLQANRIYIKRSVCQKSKGKFEIKVPFH